MTARDPRPRVALVTCAELPEGDPDDLLLVDPLAAHGIGAVPAVWDDPQQDWGAYALVVVRSPWDYAARREEFIAWADTVPRLANPAATADGVPTVPTVWLEPGDPARLPSVEDPDGGTGSIVVKPTVGAGSKDTGRYDPARPREAALAVAHAERLLSAGRGVMVQPYLPAVDTAGESALVLLDGRFSHSVRKGPMLDGPDTGGVGLYREERIDPREPAAAELDLAATVLGAVPGPGRRAGTDLGAAPLYARVDLLPGVDGSPVLLELELTEPSLFLGHSAGAAERFADAISRVVPG